MQSAARFLLTAAFFASLTYGCTDTTNDGAEPFYIGGAADGFGPSLRVPFVGENLQLDIGAGFTDYFYYDVGQSHPPVDDPGYRDFIHGGIDFRVPAGTGVYAMQPGTIVDRPTYPMAPGVSLTIQGQNGLRWVYTHIDFDTIPAELQDGAEVELGHYLGSVIQWFEDQIDVSDNGRYDHLHLDVYERVTGDGGSSETLANIDQLLALPDETAPSLVALHFVRAGSDVVESSLEPQTAEPLLLDGSFELVLQAFDYRDRLILGPQGEVAPLEASSFPTGIGRAEVQLLAAGEDAPVFSAQCSALSSLPADWDARPPVLLERHRRVLFFDGVETRAIKDRFVKRTFINLLEEREQGELSNALLNTEELSAGTYRLVITLWDERENTSIYEHELTIPE